MQHDENGLHFSREDLLSDLELLQSFYNVLGREQVIDWILKKESKYFGEDCRTCDEIIKANRITDFQDCD